ncbi:MAG: GTP-binding protein [Candidatus Lokiarchaeota archaeon]|nr:GTP-binding protein [Candidatus Lokiarchaeota archaeon]MBD3199551.1 GTP-binding protein [Candidatus Lokiarchaeota archaeon]
MESHLRTLLRNYMNSMDGIIATAIVDKNGLIITSDSKEEAGENSDMILGAISAILDDYIERIKKEFDTESSFFNITTTGDKKFAFCSKGPHSILTTVTKPDTSETEIKVLSEHVAGKIELLLEGKKNVAVNIPEIVKVLSQTKGGTLPKGEYSSKLILTGDFSVGKTSLIRRFVENRFQDKYISTIGVDISKHIVKLTPETNVNYIIWDIGGQGHKNFASHRKRFYNGANCALIVFDRTRPKTLNDVEEWYDDIKESVDSNIPIVLVGNKSDLIDEVVVSEEEVKQIAGKLGFNYILTSAKTGDNVDDAFLYVAYKFLQKLQ